MRFRLLLGLLLIGQALLLTICIARNSACFDEGAHLAAGLASVRFAENSVYDLSPPLARQIAAIPVWLDGADIPPAKSFRDISATQRHWVYFGRFEEWNLLDLESYIILGRLALLPMAMVLSLVIFTKTRNLAGPLAGIVAAGLWAFDPNVIALGSVIGTDMAVTLAMFASLFCWIRFLKNGQKRWVLLTGVAVGAAHAIKFTAIALWPALAAVAWALGTERRVDRKTLLAGAAMVFIFTWVLVNADYGFRRLGTPVNSFDFRSPLGLRLKASLPESFPLFLPHDLIEGFDAQMYELNAAYPNAVFGQGYFGSHWLYYPWSILSTLPIGTLIILALALAQLRPRRLSPMQRALLAYLAVIAAISIFGAKINLGLRYLLPLYPVVLVLAGRVVNVQRLRMIVLVALTATVVESSLAAPRFHSFSNWAVQRWPWQVNNRDSGQSLIELREWMRSTNVLRISLAYHGVIDPEVYDVHWIDALVPPRRTPPYIAISRDLLQGLPQRTPNGFAFVRSWREIQKLKPVADFGGMLVYSGRDIAATSPKPWSMMVRFWPEVANDPALVPMRGADRDRVPRTVN